MDYKFLLKRLPLIIFHPVKAWDTIYSETFSLKDTRNSYLFPLTIIVALAAFLGSLIFTNSQLPVLYSVFVGLKYILVILFVVYLSAIIHKEITYALDLGKSFDVSYKIIVYSITPLLLCLTVTNLFESLIFADILALYGLYIFWTGSEKMFNPPDHKKMPMLIAAVVVVVAFYLSAAWVINQLIDRIYYSLFD